MFAPLKGLMTCDAPCRVLAAPRSGSPTAATPPQSGAHALPSATPAPRIRSSHPPPRSPPHANPLLALLVSLGAASLRVALGVVRIERATERREPFESQPSVAPVPSPVPHKAGVLRPGGGHGTGAHLPSNDC